MKEIGWMNTRKRAIRSLSSRYYQCVEYAKTYGKMELLHRESLKQKEKKYIYSFGNKIYSTKCMSLSRIPDGACYGNSRYAL